MKHVILATKIILLCLTVTLSNYYAGYSVGNFLTVKFFDVGQGDSIYLETYDRRSMLIDGGPDNTVLDELIKNRSRFDNYLDVIVLTHPDLDHIGGLFYVVDRYDIGKVIISSDQLDERLLDEFLYILKEKKIEYIEVDELSDFQLGCCTYIDIIWPEANLHFDEYDINDTSVSMIVSYNDFDLYLAGDLGKEYETEIARKNLFDIEVMKLSHHGSKTSTSKYLLNSLSPEIAVVSAGKDNSFGHPNEEVVELVKSQNIQVLSTIEMGTISLKTDGDTYWLN